MITKVGTVRPFSNQEKLFANFRKSTTYQSAITQSVATGWTIQSYQTVPSHAFFYTSKASIQVSKQCQNNRKTTHISVGLEQLHQIGISPFVGNIGDVHSHGLCFICHRTGGGRGRSGGGRGLRYERIGFDISLLLIPIILHRSGRGRRSG